MTRDTDTTVIEIADGIFRLSTYLDPPGMVFNQFLVVDEESLVFHLGHRRLFPQVHQAVGRVLDPRAVRWVSFGHLEADECGAMNEWLALAPSATVVRGTLGVDVSLNDMADRRPHSLADGASLDLGAKRVTWIDTPQLPHGWEAGLLFEATTATLFAGDLFTSRVESSRRAKTTSSPPRSTAKTVSTPPPSRRRPHQGSAALRNSLPGRSPPCTARPTPATAPPPSKHLAMATTPGSVPVCVTTPLADSDRSAPGDP